MEGFTTDSTKEMANHAIAFMVKGIFDKWKQPIGYFLSRGPMSGSLIKSHVLDCLTKLDNIGLVVTIIVCDQGSNNRNLFEKQLGITVEEPYFLHNNREVFCMYDPPHLLKNIRNNLKKHGFVVEDKAVSWAHIAEFFKKDSKSATCLAPLLSKCYIDPPPFAPLWVCLAAQVLSHSVASGITAMVDWGILPGTCIVLYFAFNRLECPKACLRL